MPAKSQAQQKLMGLVHAIQQGKAKPSSGAGEIAKTMDPGDAKDFASTSHEGLPQHVDDNHNLAAETISKYNEYGKHFQSAMTMGELAERLMAVAEYAEQAVMSEADDWFDGHTIQRNMKEIKGYVKEFAKVAQEHDGLRQRMSALYDDMGRVLERYFEISETGGGETGPDTTGDITEDPISYDTGEDEIEIGNSDKNPVPSDLGHQMAHEDDTDNPRVTQMAGWLPGGEQDKDHGAPFDMDDQHIGIDDDEKDDINLKKEDEMPMGDTPGLQRAKNLSERMVKLARERLKGENLVRFDTLPREIQIRAAWKIIK